MNYDVPAVAGRPLRVKPASWSTGGFTLMEVMVASVLLGLILVFALGGLLYGMKEGSRGMARAATAAWMDAEINFLRAQGYAGLADDVTAGTRTLTQTTGYTTYGGLTEPVIPAGSDRAEIVVTNVTGLSLRKLTIRLFETPASTSPEALLSTYVADVSSP